MEPNKLKNFVLNGRLLYVIVGVVVLTLIVILISIYLGIVKPQNYSPSVSPAPTAINQTPPPASKPLTPADKVLMMKALQSVASDSSANRVTETQKVQMMKALQTSSPSSKTSTLSTADKVKMMQALSGK